MSRKITVLVEKTQSKVVLESNATTLGELKGELRGQGADFNYDDVFKEARTKSILVTDESVLPTNVPWKGGVTNELVFMITVPHKKISSGAVSRAEVYAKVKELDLQDVIQRETGKNYTQCKTEVLADYVSRFSAPKKVEVKETVTTSVLSHLGVLLNKLVNANCISKDVADNIWGVANGQPAQPVEDELSYDKLLRLFDF